MADPLLPLPRALGPADQTQKAPGSQKMIVKKVRAATERMARKSTAG